MKETRELMFLPLLATVLTIAMVGGTAPAQETSAPDLQRVLRTLDTDGDSELSTDEIQAATERLMSLDADGNGEISLEEMGGPAPLRGTIRQQTVIRILDRDGDLVISAQELAEAGRNLARLDDSGDWRLDTSELGTDLGDAVADDDATVAANPNFFRMNAWVEEMEGAILPGEDERAFEGYTLIHDSAFGYHNANRIYLIDSSGAVVHEWEPGPWQYDAAIAYLLPNGLLLRTVSKHDWLHMRAYPVGANGTVQLLDWDSNVVWEYEMDVPGKHVLHHDVEYLPNGNILAVAYQGFSNEEARSMGWDGEYPRHPRRIVWFNKIVELQPNLEDGSTEIVWQWNSWDHLVQDKFPGRPNYGDVSAETGKLDVNFLRDDYVLFNAGQIHHVNTVEFHQEWDLIVLSSAIHGELWFIDHSTTMEEAAGDSGGRYGVGGDLVYRWGSPAPTKTGTLHDAILWWQHDPNWIEEGLPGAGNMLVYNNGTKRGRDGMHHPDMGQDFEQSWAEIFEIALPTDADGRFDATRETEIVWSWNSDGSEGYFSPFMSGAMRMPNGNTIFVNAHNKHIIEVTPEGERVLDYRVPGPGRMYRIYKYPVDYPAFEGRQL